MPLRRQVSVNFSQETIEAIHQFQMAENLSSIAEAVRCLVAMALAPTAQEGLNSAQAYRAYIETRKWLLDGTMTWLRETHELLEESIKRENGNTWVG